MGLSSGMIVVIVIGFFVLLSITISQKTPTTGLVAGAAATNNNPPVQAPAPQPQAERQASIQVEPITSSDHVKGDRNARVSIVEFSDTECPFCKRFHPTMKQIIDEYNGQINWVYRHFPLVSLHSKAPKEAEATECASELGGNEVFWAYIDRLFEITPANNGLDPAQLSSIAEYVGLNKTSFESCLSSGKYTDVIQTSISQAQQAGGTGTPYSIVVVDGKPVTTIMGAQSYEEVKRIIESVL